MASLHCLHTRRERIISFSGRNSKIIGSISTLAMIALNRCSSGVVITSITVQQATPQQIMSLYCIEMKSNVIIYYLELVDFYPLLVFLGFGGMCTYKKFSTIQQSTCNLREEARAALYLEMHLPALTTKSCTTYFSLHNYKLNRSMQYFLVFIQTQHPRINLVRLLTTSNTRIMQLP